MAPRKSSTTKENKTLSEDTTQSAAQDSVQSELQQETEQGGSLDTEPVIGTETEQSAISVVPSESGEIEAEIVSTQGDEVLLESANTNTEEILEVLLKPAVPAWGEPFQDIS